MTGTVEVSVHVAAAPETVFPYFTDPVRYVQWMGSEAALDPRPGGVYQVSMRDGFRAAGTFGAVDPPRQVVFTWGFANHEAASHTLHQRGEATSGSAMPAGSTRVTVTLEPEDGGTRLTLRHEDLPSAELAEGHQIAWETYLPRLVTRITGGDPGPDPHSKDPAV
jgi:uncharacterized protein YndB with AHSA1/START domain